MEYIFHLGFNGKTYEYLHGKGYQTVVSGILSS